MCLDNLHKAQDLISSHPQDEIDASVKVLLALKTEYKAQTGQDYQPGKAQPQAQVVVPAEAQAKSCSADDLALYNKVTAQGEVVRELKIKKAGKVHY